LDDGAYDVTNVGKHLSGLEFHNHIGKENTVVVDMRNYYESEIGRFEGALCPEADTFREELEIVTDLLEDKKDQKILLYCTGGIRCEKASAYLKYKGFKDVNQVTWWNFGICPANQNLPISNQNLWVKTLFSTSDWVKV
jgi:UPF0176 protein